MKYIKPKIIPNAAYEEARRELVETCRKVAGIRTVYEAGSVTQPGLSDLDFLLVLGDEYCEKQEIEKSLSAKARQLIGQGTILKVGEGQIGNVRVIDDFSLRRLWGREYEIAEYVGDLYETARVIDWLPERVTRLERLMLQEEVEVAFAYQLLKSMVMSLRKVASLVEGYRMEDFEQMVLEARARWFSEENTRQLTDLLTRAKNIGLEAIEIVAQYLQRMGLVAGDKFGGVSVTLKIPRGPYFRFGEGLPERVGEMVLPEVYGWYFAAQAEAAGGFIGNQLKQCFGHNFPLEAQTRLRTDFWEVTQRRMQYVEKVALFLRKRQVKKGLLKYGWFL